jgi:hypothetical protein
MKHFLKVMDYRFSMVDISKNLKIVGNGKSLVVMHQDGQNGGNHFFVLSLESEDNIIAKLINAKDAKMLVAYLNAHIILAEND